MISRFLVAHLQIEALKGCMSPRALMNTLETLPTSINDLYRHTLTRIDAQSEPEVLLAKRAMLWLVYGLEPLSMKQLQHALATNLDLGIFDEDDIVRGEFIFDVCCGLVSKSNDSPRFPTLRLIRKLPVLCRTISILTAMFRLYRPRLSQGSVPIMVPCTSHTFVVHLRGLPIYPIPSP